jgi:hypothetical protein
MIVMKIKRYRSGKTRDRVVVINESAAYIVRSSKNDKLVCRILRSLTLTYLVFSSVYLEDLKSRKRTSIG